MTTETVPLLTAKMATHWLGVSDECPDGFYEALTALHHKQAVCIPADRLRELEAELEKYRGGVQTHGPDCWSWGWRHYGCAEGEIARLKAELATLRVAAAERDELDGRLDEMTVEHDARGHRIAALEGEIAAIKAGGGEPVAWRYEWSPGYGPEQWRDGKPSEPEKYRRRIQYAYTHPHVTLTEEQVRADFKTWRRRPENRDIHTIDEEWCWLACAKHYGRVGGGT